MLPILTDNQSTTFLVKKFCEILAAHKDFNAEVCLGLDQRYVHAVDNSIYEIVPDAIIYPRCVKDIQILLAELKKKEFRSISLHAKGGGTSTNGQSLGRGIILDSSKYLNKIIDFDPINKTVTVQTGVILDQLNNYLSQHNMCFAPSTSTSSRVTIGGMVGTDASGIGSRVYGKTSESLLSCKMAVLGGDIIKFSANQKKISAKCNQRQNTNQSKFITKLINLLSDIKLNKFELIEASFNDMPRFFSGFNLKRICKIATINNNNNNHSTLKKSCNGSTRLKALDAIDEINDKNKNHSSSPDNHGKDGQKVSQEDEFDLCALVAGSEGVLGVFTELELKVIDSPKYEHLVVCFFDDFEKGTLDHCRKFLDYDPVAMEIVDNNLFKVFVQHRSYPGSFLQEVLEKDYDFDKIKSLSLLMISFKHSSKTKASKAAFKLLKDLDSEQARKKLGLTNFVTYIDSDKLNINSYLWSLRKKAVGLFNSLHSLSAEGRSWYKSISFVEDVAVKPACVVPFIKDFIDLLNSYNLEYGIYGHVDVGCVHVRPRFDIFDEQLMIKVRQISDKTFALSKKHAGVLWGEHSKGFRSEYLKEFFGDDLYALMCKIKSFFDPYNQLNPNKICPPETMILSKKYPKLDQIPTRYEFDQTLTVPYRRFFKHSLACDGNGVCFSKSPKLVMCPSYQATNSRIHSPKGRAMLMKLFALKLQKKNFLIASNSVIKFLSAGESLNTKKINNSLAFLSRLVSCTINYVLSIISSLYLKLCKKDDYSKKVYNAMHACLSCKGCSYYCPLGVDIPELKSRFLYLYHSRYLRHPRDYVIAMSEFLLPLLAKNAFLVFCFNYLNSKKMIIWCNDVFLRLVDLPNLNYQKTSKNSRSVIEYCHSKQKKAIKQTKDSAKNYTHAEVNADNDKESGASNHARRIVVVSQDMNVFLDDKESFDSVLDVLEFFKIDYVIEPYRSSAKAIHSLGFLSLFQYSAKKRLGKLIKFCKGYLKNKGYKAEVIEFQWLSIDPAFCLVYRQEYKVYDIFEKNQFKNHQLHFSSNHPLLIPEFFVERFNCFDLSADLINKFVAAGKKYNIYLLLHCQEQAQPENVKNSWKVFFKHLALDVNILELGCCGLAGFWGYQKEFSSMSKDIFALHWQRFLTNLAKKQKSKLVESSVSNVLAVNENTNNSYSNSKSQSMKKTVVLVSGGSCRKQIQRINKLCNDDYFDEFEIMHPMVFIKNLCKS